MFDKLDFIVEKYKELSLKVSDPDVINDQPVWQKQIKEMGEMEPIVKEYEEYKKAKEELEEAKEIRPRMELTRNCASWPRWSSMSWRTEFKSWKMT